MECLQYIEQIYKVLEEQQELTTNPNLETHLTQCSQCTRFFNEMKNLFQKIDQIPFPELSPNFASKVYQKIQQQNQSKILFSFKNRTLISLAAVALICITVYITFFVYNQKNSKKKIQSTPQIGHKIPKTPLKIPRKNNPLNQEKNHQKMAIEFKQWVDSIQPFDSSPKQFGLFQTLSVNMKNQGLTLKDPLPKLTNMTEHLFSSNAPKNSPNKPFEEVGQDISNLVKEVAKDLSFLSFGL